MAENLNIGTMINGSNNQSQNGTIEKYCYNDDANNCVTYGGLYQWDEMMQYGTTGAQGICPTGWHLPTDAEWKTMEMYLGMSQAQADASGWRGTDEGSKLAGNEPLWANGNLDQNVNFGTSGFTGLPGDYRDSDGSFGVLGSYGYWWSGTEYSSTGAWRRLLYCDSDQVYRDSYVKTGGFSVRCLKN